MKIDYESYFTFVCVCGGKFFYFSLCRNVTSSSFYVIYASLCTVCLSSLLSYSFSFFSHFNSYIAECYDLLYRLVEIFLVKSICFHTNWFQFIFFFGFNSVSFSVLLHFSLFFRFHFLSAYFCNFFETGLHCHYIVRFKITTHYMYNYLRICKRES